MKKIALVEDDKPTSDALKRLLETIPGMDVEVTQLFSHSDAIAAIEGTRFDLLVVDIELGSHAQEHHKGLSILAEHGQDCPTIIVTGMPESNLRQVALTLKAYDFIAKPVDDHAFQHRVAQALAFASTSIATSGRAQSGLPPGLTADPKRAPQLRWKNHGLTLTLTELTIVHQLASQAGSVVPHLALAPAMKTGAAKALQVHMVQIRRKFEDVDPTFANIQTAPGKGYMWAHDA